MLASSYIRIVMRWRSERRRYKSALHGNTLVKWMFDFLTGVMVETSTVRLCRNTSLEPQMVAAYRHAWRMELCRGVEPLVSHSPQRKSSPFSVTVYGPRCREP